MSRCRRHRRSVIAAAAAAAVAECARVVSSLQSRTRRGKKRKRRHFEARPNNEVLPLLHSKIPLGQQRSLFFCLFRNLKRFLKWKFLKTSFNSIIGSLNTYVHSTTAQYIVHTYGEESVPFLLPLHFLLPLRSIHR